MSAQNNLTIDKGTDFIYNIHLIDSSGVPVDISDFTGNSQMRTSYSSNVHVTLDVAISTANNGLITLSMNSETSSTLTASRYLYDLTLTSSNNVVSRLMEGFVTINPSVTR